MTSDHLLEERARMADLLGIYGKLLTEKQSTIASAYYLYDLSLSEIAEQEGISRAGVSDALNKASEHLEHYEKCLCLLSRSEHIKTMLRAIRDLPESERLAAYEKLGKELENGI